MSNEEKRTLKAMEREREQEYLAFIEENKRIIYKVCYRHKDAYCGTKLHNSSYVCVRVVY